jgi:DNA-binding NtrC family response regulator
VARQRILVVDDEEAIRFGISEYLQARGYEVAEADGCEAAEKALRALRPDAAILDYSLPDGNALEWLPRLRAAAPGVPLVILTGHGSIELAVRAIKEGAEQFLTKPVELSALAVVIERLLESRRASQRDVAGRRREERLAPDPFLGRSPAIRALAEEAGKLAASDSPVLIQGETGSGKGVLAAWLHARSARAGEAFVDLNCAGLSKEFLETELFGHEKGAFTGAIAMKPGLLEIAHRGSLFLDEIGDMDLAVQSKLLKVLEEQRFRRLGEVKDRRVDVRLIAATHVDLRAQVASKAFRSDLYFRISTLPLRVPPLRERPGDVALLAEHLLGRIARELGRMDLRLSDEARDALAAWSWPGNVRELRNVLERAALLASQPVLTRRDLRFDGAGSLEAEAVSGSLEEMEKRAIERALAEEGGNVVRAAKRLQVPRSTLYQKIKAHGLKAGG